MITFYREKTTKNLTAATKTLALKLRIRLPPMLRQLIPGDALSVLKFHAKFGVT